MATGSIPTAASALSTGRPSAACCSPSPQDRLPRISFPRAKPLAPLKGRRAACNGEAFVRRAQLSEEKIVSGASNDGAALVSKTEEREDVGKEAPLPEVQMTAEAISEFMDQVSDLVRLVDSKDVVELQLKQPGCELLIRKKEAMPAQLPSMHAMVMPAHHTPHPVAPSAYSPPPPAPVPPQQAATPPSAPATAADAAQPPKSSHPPLKSPMAGTFYRSPAPGQPPFVKVGDRVREGQVLCIIEAMKLMNEIEADHDGTVVEIFLEDAKPVGVGQPLFVIEP